MATLALIRHGQASFLAEDYDRLSPLGERQSTLLGEHWARRGVTFDRVYSGPRVRQIRTAELVGEAVRRGGGAWPAPVILEELDEMRAEDVFKHALPELSRADPRIAELLAAFEAAKARPDAGRRFQSLFSSVMAMWVRGEIQAPGIEPWSDFLSRVRRGIALVRAGGGGRVAAFSSGGPVSAAMQLALGTADEATLELAWVVRNAAISEFLYSGDRFTLSSFNTLAHLDDPALWTYR